MKNVYMVVEDSILTITIDLKQTFGASKSGKSTVIASTEGNRPVYAHPGVFIGLNVYKTR